MLATLLVAPFMAQVDTTIANVATPSIHSDLHASGAELELVIGGFYEAVLVVLLGTGGLGLGLQFSSIVSRMSGDVGPEAAADLSGATSTTIQVAGAVAVSAFGSVYLAMASGRGVSHATHAFASVSIALAAIAVFAAASSYFSTRPAIARRSAR